MYIPGHFRVDDAHDLAEIMRRHSFATLITTQDGTPFASHMPVLFEAEKGPHGTLISHLARANPQSQHFAAGQEAMVIFQGPHAYISPSWYEADVAVPTWNYIAVHAYGRANLIDDPARIETMLHELVRYYESGRATPWHGRIPEEYMHNMMKGIVAFEIPIQRIEGKFKLSQNRSQTDRHGVYEALAGSPHEEEQALATIMAERGLM